MKKVDNIRLKGMLTVESSYNGGWYGQCKVIREYLPSTDLPALIENYLLINTDKNPMFVEIPVINNRLYTDPRKGVDGSYLIEMKIDRNGYFSIQPGDTLSFSAYITGYKKGQPALVINGQQEKLKRIEAVTSWMDNLVLETLIRLLTVCSLFLKSGLVKVSMKLREDLCTDLAENRTMQLFGLMTRTEYII